MIRSAVLISLITMFKLALPGYVIKFPQDHYSHPDYKTEWWYYTGHLRGEDGTRYGYELTFFRSAMETPRPVKAGSQWAVRDAYLAHFAVSDLNEKRFFHTERLNRAGVGFAGADEHKFDVWNQNWHVMLLADGKQKLIANDPNYSIELTLISKKPPALHGLNGLSQKASCRGCASYYYSMTRLDSVGTIKHSGKSTSVKGITWMDHEFGSNQLTAEQVGWDWFSVQLDDNSELMLYLMRRRDGTYDPTSSGTIIRSDGTTQHLRLQDYAVKATGSWKSTHSTATYPMGWKISIPSTGAELEIRPEMQDQELARGSDNDVTYWEGTCTVQGNIKGKPIAGEAYVEMTGYAENFSKRI